MKFVAKEDITLSQQVFYDRMADFQMFERVAIRRGVEVTRSGSIAAADGLKWDCTFEFRGRDRTACVRLAEFSDPEKMMFFITNPALDNRVEITVSALSKKQSRFQVSTVLEPKTLTARLLVQSMKLARSNIISDFKNGSPRWPKNWLRWGQHKGFGLSPHSA